MPTKGRKSKSSRAGNKLLRVDGHTYFTVVRCASYRMQDNRHRSASKTRQESTAVLRVPRANVSAPRSDGLLCLGMSWN